MNTYYIIRTTNKNEDGDPIYYISRHMDEFVTTRNLRNAGHFYSLDTAEKALAKIKSDGGPKGLSPYYQWEICPVYDKRGIRRGCVDVLSENEQLKREFDMACGNIGKLADENRKLKREVKDYKERTAVLQRQLDEAAADRWEAQTKLAVKSSEFKLIMNSFYGFQIHWFDLTTIDHVIFNDPATIVFWKDGTKTVVKNSDRKKFDPEKGLAMAICKKLGGNKGSYYNAFKKWLPKK